VCWNYKNNSGAKGLSLDTRRKEWDSFIFRPPYSMKSLFAGQAISWPSFSGQDKQWNTIPVPVGNATPVVQPIVGYAAAWATSLHQLNWFVLDLTKNSAAKIMSLMLCKNRYNKILIYAKNRPYVGLDLLTFRAIQKPWSWSLHSKSYKHRP